MTINEAEKQYSLEVENCIEQHKIKLETSKHIWIFISFVFIFIGSMLAIIGFNTPPETTPSGYESESTAVKFVKIFGITSICLGVFFLLVIIPLLINSQKKGPENFLPQIKNLYLNYLKCEDMSDDDKEFYKQKLENIRNIELVNAINRASASASAAIMFNTLHK